MTEQMKILKALASVMPDTLLVDALRVATLATTSPVDLWDHHRDSRAPLTIAEWNIATDTARLLLEEEPDLADNKILFIKTLRGSLPGMALVDSKSIVESLID